MSGAGNLFSVIDNSQHQFSDSELRRITPVLCSENEYNPNRAEGLLSISESKENAAQFNVEFYNPDGSKDAMCGNGGRCAVAFAMKHNFIEKDHPDKIKFSMSGDIYISRKTKNNIMLFFPAPKKMLRNIEIESGDAIITGDQFDVGSEHFVIHKENIKKFNDLPLNSIDFINFAKPIRYNEELHANGINVSLYEKMNSGEIRFRTFERGVEAETGACGTGAISVAISAVFNDLTNFPVKLIPPSGQELIVDVKGTFPSDIRKVILEGGAEVLDEYEINIPKEIIYGNQYE